MKNKQHKLALVLALYNSNDFVVETVEELIFKSLLNQDLVKTELMIIDDKSPNVVGTDRILEKYVSRLRKKFAKVTVVRHKKNLGYTKTVNRALREVDAEIVGFLNSDIYLPRGSVRSLVETLDENDEAAAVGPVSNNVWSRQQINSFSGLKGYDKSEIERVEMFSKKVRELGLEPMPVKYLQGHCLFIRSSVFEEFGVFDEDLGEMFCEDVDFCLNVIKRRKVLVDRKTFIQHGSANGSFGSSWRSILVKTFSRFLYAIFAYVKKNGLFKYMWLAFYQVAVHYFSFLNMTKYYSFDSEF